MSGSTAAPLVLTNSFNATSQGRNWSCGPESTGNFSIYNSGSVGVYLAWGGTSWTATSDARLKRDIVEMGGALDAVKRLRPVFFQYKTDDASSFLRSGFVAQEVAEVFPVGSSWIVGQSEGVISTEDGEVVRPMTVSATELIPHMVRAIQELAVAGPGDDKMKLLEEDYAALKEDHAALKEDHAALKEDHASLKDRVARMAEWLRNTQGVTL